MQSQKNDPAVAKGVRCFKAGEYAEAIDAFTEAITARPDRANLYDSRAAAYEKLGKLGPALKDAKKVIDLKPDLVKGYLRSARLFKRAGKLDNAVKMYSLAIAKSTGDETEALAKELAEAQSVKMARDERDRLATTNFSLKLPLDLFVEIMLLLDARQRVRCSSVCRSWNVAIRSTPLLWTTLELDGSSRLSEKKIKMWGERLRDTPSGLRELRLVNLGSAKAKALEQIQDVKWARRLRRLAIDNGEQAAGVDLVLPFLFFGFAQANTLTSLVIKIEGMVIFVGTLGDILDALPHLSEFTMTGQGGKFKARQLVGPGPSSVADASVSGRGNRLRSLALTWTHFVGPLPEGLDFSNLEHLQVHSLSAQPPMDTTADLRARDPLDWSQLGNLRRLILSDGPGAKAGPAHTGVFEFTAFGFPKLENLVVSGVPEILEAVASHKIPLDVPGLRSFTLGHVPATLANDFVLDQARNWPLLETLEIPGVTLRASVSEIFVHLPHLRRLTLPQTELLNESIESVVLHARKLEYLDVSFCVQLTGSPLMRLVGSRTEKDATGRVVRCGLREMVLDGCTGVARDAIDWIKGMGCKVRNKNWDAAWEGRGGRKLRLG